MVEDEELCICPICKGEGVICTLEPIAVGGEEGHVVPTGLRACDCQRMEEEYTE